MHQITKTEEYDLWVTQTDRPFSFSAPFGGQDFALLLVICDTAITDVEREVVSTEIVRQGCRYAVCTGHECSRWDDAIDYAYIATDPNFSPSGERLVMTTWHEDERLDEVAYFLRWLTMFDDFVPQHYLVLVLGDDAVKLQQVRSALEKWF